MSARLTIATLKASPEPCGLMAVPADHPDAIIVAAWNKRQEALAAIEARCRFYDADDDCPEELATFDAMENGVPHLPAATPYGLLAKLWVSMSHRGPMVENEEMRAESDAIRRADFAECEAIIERMDFDQATIFRAIRDLTNWLRFEQPQMKLAIREGE